MIVPMGSLIKQIERLPEIVEKQYGWDLNTKNLKTDILRGYNELHLIDKDLVLLNDSTFQIQKYRLLCVLWHHNQVKIYQIY